MKFSSKFVLCPISLFLVSLIQENKLPPCKIQYAYIVKQLSLEHSASHHFSSSNAYTTSIYTITKRSINGPNCAKVKEEISQVSRHVNYYHYYYHRRHFTIIIIIEKQQHSYSLSS